MTAPKPILYPVIPAADRRPLGWLFGGRLDELRGLGGVR